MSNLLQSKGGKVIRSIRELKIRGQRVFIRLDLNVPLSVARQSNDPEALITRTIEDETRILEALPTIQYAIDQGAKVILASHLGRPDGEIKTEYSLEPIAHRLAVLLKLEVMLADDCVGDGIQLMVQGLKNGQVLLLENLRFHKGEEANDLEFSQQLAKLADVYVNDAFGAAHRKHASTYGMPSLMQNKAIGFLMEKELKFLEPLLENPKRPFIAILGGSKVTDKIKTIETLFRKVDGLLIGGAMAHAFWAAQGDTVPAGAKQPNPKDIEAARALFKIAKERDLKILVPKDTNQGFDIGPKTVESFCQALANAKTIFWNGPLGWFEKPEYATGTNAVAQFVAGLSAVKVVGGGDTVSAIKQSGFAESFDHLSTGGGAVLEFLEGNGLPGIEALKLPHRLVQNQLANEKIAEESAAAALAEDESSDS